MISLCKQTVSCSRKDKSELKNLNSKNIKRQNRFVAARIQEVRVGYKGKVETVKEKQEGVPVW